MLPFKHLKLTDFNDELRIVTYNIPRGDRHYLRVDELLFIDTEDIKGHTQVKYRSDLSNWVAFPFERDVRVVNRLSL